MVFHFEGIACLKAAEATEKFEAVLLVAHHSQAVGDCDCRPHLVGRFLLGQILCFFFVDDQLYVGLLVRVGRQEVVLKLQGGSSVKPAAVALESLDLQTIFKKKHFFFNTWDKYIRWSACSQLTNTCYPLSRLWSLLPNI